MPRKPGPKITVKCTACGKGVERTPRQVAAATSGRFFCSLSCQRRVGVKPTTIKERPCEICGVMFKPISHKHVGRFCSVACREQWQARNRVERHCEVCGKSFFLSRSTVAKAPARTCSRACDSIARVSNPVGRMHNGKPARSQQNGYVYVWEPDNPDSHSNGWILEHRLVASEQLGRPLESDEQVHHINGNKVDNRPENLVVLSPSAHTAITLSDIGVRRAAQQKRIRELEAQLAEYEHRFGPL